MCQRLIVSALIVAIVLTGCASAAPAEPRIETDPEGGVVISDSSGVTLSIPPDGLYQSAELVITGEEVPADADTKTFFFPDDEAFSIELEGDDAFRLPVEIAIPYDEGLLPEGSVEAQIFPVYLYEGEWYRQEGTVDQEANVVKVLTVHNGIWDWAVDLAENITDDTANFFCIEGQDLPTLEEAIEEENLRWIELADTLDRTQMNMEEIEEPDIALDVGEFLLDEEASFIVSNELAKFAEFGGRDALIRIGNQRVGMWLGRLGSAVSIVGLAQNGFYIFNQAYKLGDASYQVYDLLRAYGRWREAKAIVFALKNGCMVQNMHPEDAAALEAYYRALPIDQTLARPAQLDLSISAVSETNELLVAESQPLPQSEEVAEPAQAEEGDEGGSLPTCSLLYHDWAGSLAILELPSMERKIIFQPDGYARILSPAAWSPSGNLIAYTSVDSIRVMSPAGENDHEIYSDKTGLGLNPANDLAWSSLSWSPDGRTIIWGCSKGICAVDVDGSNPRVLYEGTYVIESPMWLSDSHHIVFGGNILDLRDGSLTKYTELGVSGYSLSPDGGRIALTSYDGHVYVAELDGSNVVRLTPEPAFRVSNPRWTPDGKWILFVRTEECQSTDPYVCEYPAGGIWAVRADGGGTLLELDGWTLEEGYITPQFGNCR